MEKLEASLRKKIISEIPLVQVIWQNI